MKILRKAGYTALLGAVLFSPGDFRTELENKQEIAASEENGHEYNLIVEYGIKDLLRPHINRMALESRGFRNRLSELEEQGKGLEELVDEYSLMHIIVLDAAQNNEDNFDKITRNVAEIMANSDNRINYFDDGILSALRDWVEVKYERDKRLLSQKTNKKGVDGYLDILYKAYTKEEHDRFVDEFVVTNKNLYESMRKSLGMWRPFSWELDKIEESILQEYRGMKNWYEN